MRHCIGPRRWEKIRSAWPDSCTLFRFCSARENSTLRLVIDFVFVHNSRMSKNEITPDLLSACLQRHFGEASKIRLEAVRTGKFNSSFFATVDGRELVLRIAPPKDSVLLFYERDMMKQEPEIHDLLLMGPRIPVPPIIVFDESHELVDRDFLIMERLPGHPMCEATACDEEAIFQEVGALLADVHRLTAAQYGYLGPHRPMTPQPNWNDAFAIMWRKLLDDIVCVGQYSDEDRTFLLKLLDHHLPVFSRQVPASLLHMDIWQQNILISEHGVLTGLIDWDRALWGDPEIEFAVLDYCGISTPAFWEGYGQARDASPEARIRNTFYLLYELQKYIVIEQGRNNDSHKARQYKQQAFQCAQHLLSS